MTSENNIELLRAELLNDQVRPWLDAVNELIKTDPFAVDHFITLLDNENPVIRDKAAIGLHDLADNKALEPLLKAINKPENINSRGTLVYALDSLDCSAKLPELFDLMFYGNAEVRMSAINILDEQIFEFSRSDLYSIKDKWEKIQKQPELCPYYDEYKDTIETLVESYLEYLK